MNEWLWIELQVDLRRKAPARHPCRRFQGVQRCVSGGKVAVIIGAGQSPGEGIGNGRATTLRFAQEGAKVLAVDRLVSSAEETAAMAAKEGSECVPFAADVTRKRRSPRQ